MNVIRETRFRGILPAGLVLNAKMPTRSSGGALGFVKPIIKDYDGPIPAGDIAVMVKGTFLDPVLLADLRQDTSRPYGDDVVTVGSFKLDPYHDAVMLMTSVEFSGILTEISGAWAIAKLPEMRHDTVNSYMTFHPTSGKEVLTSQKVCAPALACDVYIPKQSRLLSAFAATKTTFGHLVGGICGLNAALPDATSLPFRPDLGFEYVIKGYEFTLPPVAHSGFIQLVPTATPQYSYRVGAVSATFRPTSAEGVALAKGRFALTVDATYSAAIAQADKSWDTSPELAENDGQAIQTLMKYYAVDRVPTPFVSFGQVNDYGASATEGEF